MTIIRLFSITIYLLLFPVISFGAMLFQEDFEDTSFTSRGWYDSTSLKLSTTEHHSGNSSVEYHFLPNATTPEISGGAIRRLFTPTDEVYVSLYVKYSTNWTGSNRSYHPHEFLLLTNLEGNYAGPAYTHLTAYVENNEGIPILALQDGMNIDLTRLNQDLTSTTEQRSVSGCNGVPSIETASVVSCYSVGNGIYWNGKEWRAGGSPNSHGGTVYFQDTPGPYYKNGWHHVEAYFKLNSIANGKGIADGILRYWYDGTLIIERTNIIIRTAQHPNIKFNQFLIAPWIGDGSPVDQTMWVDNLTVGTSRDGVTGGSGGNTGGSGGDASASGGSGCGIIKDIPNKQFPKTGQIAVNFTLPLLLLILVRMRHYIVRKMRLDIKRYLKYNCFNMEEKQMKRVSILIALIAVTTILYYPDNSFAAVNLPWSTTFNCPDWSQSLGIYNVNCDGLAGDGNWTSAAMATVL